VRDGQGGRLVVASVSSSVIRVAARFPPLGYAER